MFWWSSGKTTLTGTVCINLAWTWNCSCKPLDLADGPSSSGERCGVSLGVFHVQCTSSVSVFQLTWELGRFLLRADGLTVVDSYD